MDILYVSVYVGYYYEIAMCDVMHIGHVTICDVNIMQILIHRMLKKLLIN